MRTLACALGIALSVYGWAGAQTGTTPVKNSSKAAGSGAPLRKAPELSLLRPGADPISLAQYHGKIVALTFISTVCSHCQDFTRAITPIARQYTPRGVQFLEFAVNDGAAMSLKSFQEQFHPPFPVGWGTVESMMFFLGKTPFDSMRSLSVPHMVLIDRAGMVREDYEPGSDFYLHADLNVPAALNKLLKK